MRRRGFTLIELLVALAIIALLLSIAVPRYFGGVSRTEEAALKQDLALMRDAIDKHFADTGRYPGALEELVSKKYLRAIPPDPFTQSASTWVQVPPTDARLGGVFDVKSGAPGSGADGRPYAQW
jgi:general secretion pathway protein G